MNATTIREPESESPAYTTARLGNIWIIVNADDEARPNQWYYTQEEAAEAADALNRQAREPEKALVITRYADRGEPERIIFSLNDIDDLGAFIDDVAARYWPMSEYSYRVQPMQPIMAEVDAHQTKPAWREFYERATAGELEPASTSDDVEDASYEALYTPDDSPEDPPPPARNRHDDERAQERARLDEQARARREFDQGES